MKQLWLTGLVLGLGLLGGAEAVACTRFGPDPAAELAYQQHLRQSAHTVFLARATPDGSDTSRLTTLTAIEGARPPRAASTRVLLNCGDKPPHGTVIVFAIRTAPKDVPFQPWRWGSWYVMKHLYPSEVMDPKLAQSLAQTAARLSTEPSK